MCRMPLEFSSPATVPPPAPDTSQSGSAVERLADAVLQVKRRRLHLDAKEVHVVLAAGDEWKDMSERQVQKAVAKANRQLDRSVAAVKAKTWSCVLGGVWTEEQLVVLRALAQTARTNKAVLPLDATTGTDTGAIFIFKDA